MKQMLVVFSLMLAGCGEYRTVYRLDPPIDEEGRACVTGCEHLKTACDKRANASARDTYERCQERAESDYSNCQSGTTAPREKQLCYRPVCAVAPSHGDCDELFRSCFTDCGGQVWSREECVKNC